LDAHEAAAVGEDVEHAGADSAVVVTAAVVLDRLLFTLDRLELFLLERRGLDALVLVSGLLLVLLGRRGVLAALEKLFLGFDRVNLGGLLVAALVGLLRG